MDLQRSGADGPYGDPRGRGRDDQLPADVLAAIAALQRCAPVADGADAHHTGKRASVGRVLGPHENDALTVLYRRYVSLVARAAAAVLDSSADVEDTAQDVFARLPLTIRHYQAGNFPGWLRKVARNAARVRRRSQQRRREDVLPDDSALHDRAREAAISTDDASDEVSDADFEMLANVEAVARALVALPDSLRGVVVLRAAHGLSHPAIAARLGISVNTSWVRYHRALKRLRELLRRDAPGTPMPE